MKKLLLFIVFLFVLGTYPFLSTECKLIIYRSIQSPIANFSHSKPSFFIKKKLLGFKINKLPSWAKEQISQDLNSFTNLSKAHLQKVFQENNDPQNKLIYITINGDKVTFKTTYAELESSRSYKVMFDVISFLAKNNYIPNTEFILCLEDYLPVNKNPTKYLPIFTFSKDLNSPGEKSLILIPDWMNLRSWPKLRSKIKYANSVYSWNNKENLLIWRGGIADSTGFRFKLVKLALKHPHLINAGIVERNVEWDTKIKILANNYGRSEQDVINMESFIQPEQHLKYKYQISIDGARCTWERLIWQLHAKSLVFKYESTQKQWFYNGIKPFEHYIPIFSEQDLLTKLEWAKKHESNVLAIINNANNFARNNLEIEDMFAYIAFLINQYTQRLVS